MKVAISLPDTVFQAAERLARRQRKPRSRLYAEAIAEYVGAHDTAAITERLNAVYGSQGSPLDPAFTAAQIKILANEAW
jgi:metal-responsive CopG/Arc/MetJ family transcriptional regulator